MCGAGGVGARSALWAHHHSPLNPPTPPTLSASLDRSANHHSCLSPQQTHPHTHARTQGEAEGILAISQPWPSTLRTVYGDHERYQSNYFGPFPGYYFTGASCGSQGVCVFRACACVYRACWVYGCGRGGRVQAQGYRVGNRVGGLGGSWLQAPRRLQAPGRGCNWRGAAWHCTADGCLGCQATPHPHPHPHPPHPPPPLLTHFTPTARPLFSQATAAGATRTATTGSRAGWTT